MTTSIIEEYKNIWGENPNILLDSYKYQIDLTKKLDDLNSNNLSRETLYEIILWKLNRFPRIDDKLLDDLKKIKKIEPTKHREAKELLHRLLQCPGIALPMASTILRFINPKTFQIIDDRVFRTVYKKTKAWNPNKPATVNEKFLEKSANIYFEYLDELHKLSCEKLLFINSDRILYELDKLTYKIRGQKRAKS